MPAHSWVMLWNIAVVLVLHLTVIVRRARAECPEETIEKIKTFWNGNPPRDILKSLVGTVTYVWMTRDYIQKKLDLGLHCFATNLATDMITTTDILLYRNRTPIADEITYYQRENDGVVKLQSHGEPDDTQYILSQKDNVTTFWQCKQSSLEPYEPFVGISVNMRYMESEAVKLAVEEGKKTLDNLNLNSGAPLNPCTADNIKL